MPSATLPRTNLNDQVYANLRQRILRRTPGPGKKVSLHALATEFGVSRSPVHHALTRLVAEGLLSVKARRGYFVTPVTPSMVSDAFDVRLALELHAAERAVGAVSEEQLAAFRALQAASQAAPTEEDWNTANAAFHEFQVDLAQNSVLSHVYREMPVNVIVQVIRGGRGADDDDLEHEHTAIVAAYEAGDLNAARAAIRAHVASGERRALEEVARAGGVL